MAWDTELDTGSVAYCIASAPARRLFYVGITRVKADPANDRQGSLFITYAQQMPAKDAFGANVAFKTRSGALANLLPSRFIGELGPAAPEPIAG